MAWCAFTIDFGTIVPGLFYTRWTIKLYWPNGAHGSLRHMSDPGDLRSGLASMINACLSDSMSMFFKVYVPSVS